MVRAIDGGIVGAGSEFAVDFQAGAGSAARAGLVTLAMSISISVGGDEGWSEVKSSHKHSRACRVRYDAYDGIPRQ